MVSQTHRPLSDVPAPARPGLWRFRSRLSHRLLGGFALLLALMVLTVGLALFQMGRLQAHMQSIVESNVERLVAAQSMMDAVNNVSIASLGFALANDAEDIHAQQKEIDERLLKYEAAQKHFEGLATQMGSTSQPAALSAALRERLAVYVREARTTALAVAQTALSSGNAASALLSLNPVVGQQMWAKDIQAMVAAEQALCAATYKTAQAAFARTRAVLLAVTLAALLIGSLAAWAILRSVTRPLHHAIEHARRISQGDLTGPIEADGSDELSVLLSRLADMQGHLRHMIGQMRDTSEQIYAVTGGISTGAQDLSARTEETVASLRHTAASMQHLAALVNNGAVAGQHARQGVGDASTVAARGGEVMGRVVATMEDIDQSSRRIGQIVTVIDDIAFQTNILALNAAVEAASAGEQGRGFAVVAAEVRRLAGRSAEAAQEIRSLIASNLERIGSGAQLVREAGTTMHEIVDAVVRVQVTTEAMSSTLDAQRQGMDEVGSAVKRVDQMTQQNAALAEQTASTALVLEEQSARLHEAVEIFKT
jgi:methyl-accepting chemotaxis protein